MLAGDFASPNFLLLLQDLRRVYIGVDEICARARDVCPRRSLDVRVEVLPDAQIVFRTTGTLVIQCIWCNPRRPRTGLAQGEATGATAGEIETCLLKMARQLVVEIVSQPRRIVCRCLMSNLQSLATTFRSLVKNAKSLGTKLLPLVRIL